MSVLDTFREFYVGTDFESEILMIARFAESNEHVAAAIAEVCNADSSDRLRYMTLLQMVFYAEKALAAKAKADDNFEILLKNYWRRYATISTSWNYVINHLNEVATFLDIYRNTDDWAAAEAIALAADTDPILRKEIAKSTRLEHDHPVDQTKIQQQFLSMKIHLELRNGLLCDREEHLVRLQTLVDEYDKICKSDEGLLLHSSRAAMAMSIVLERGTRTEEDRQHNKDSFFKIYDIYIEKVGPHSPAELASAAHLPIVAVEELFDRRDDPTYFPHELLTSSLRSALLRIEQRLSKPLS